MMATPLDSDDLVQHRVECDGVPGAIRVIPPANHGPGDTKRRRDGREREGHEDSLSAGHYLQVACVLQSLQDRERLDAVEVVPLHDLFEYGRDGMLQEMIEDVLPHVARARIISRARHDTAFIRDGDEEPDKVAGFPWHWRGGDATLLPPHEISCDARAVRHLGESGGAQSLPELLGPVERPVAGGPVSGGPSVDRPGSP